MISAFFLNVLVINQAMRYVVSSEAALVSTPMGVQGQLDRGVDGFSAALPLCPLLRGGCSVPELCDYYSNLAEP